MNVEVTFRFETMTVTTVVEVTNLEHYPNIRAKAISQARQHLSREYRLGAALHFVDYDLITTDVDALV
jgi:hypothetical protein